MDPSIRYQRHQIVYSESGATSTYDLESVSRLTGLHEELIVEFTKVRLVAPAPDCADADCPSFDERGLLRLRQIAELRDNQHVSLRTLRLFIRLLDRLESTEAELREMREMLR